MVYNIIVIELAGGTATHIYVIVFDDGRPLLAVEAVTKNAVSIASSTKL